MATATSKRPNPKSVAQAPPRRSRTSWWIGGFVVAACAVAAIVAFAASGDDSSTVAPGTEQVRPVSITGAALPALAATGTDPAIGLTAPTLSGMSFDGTPVSVQPGAPTLVVFLAHWCPHCQREVPRLVEWNSEGSVPSGLDVIGIATATTTDRPNYPPSTWLADAKFPWPVMADSSAGDAANAMGVSGFPYFVLLDADGNVLLRQSGEVDPAMLSAEIDQALG